MLDGELTQAILEYIRLADLIKSTFCRKKWVILNLKIQINRKISVSTCWGHTEFYLILKSYSTFHKISPYFVYCKNFCHKLHESRWYQVGAWNLQWHNFHPKSKLILISLISLLIYFSQKYTSGFKWYRYDIAILK